MKSKYVIKRADGQYYKGQICVGGDKFRPDFGSRKEALEFYPEAYMNSRFYDLTEDGHLVEMVLANTERA